MFLNLNEGFWAWAPELDELMKDVERIELIPNIKQND